MDRILGRTHLLIILLIVAYSSMAASFQGLGDLPGAGFYSEAYAVSGDGQVVVGGSQSVLPQAYSSPATEAFYWTQTAGMIGMGDFPERSFASQAKAASTNGTVIIGYGKPDWSGVQAFRWTAQTGLIGLGDLPGGIQYSEALDVSGDGSVVVGVSTGSLGSEAFIWTQAGGMVGLGYLPGGDGSYYSSSAVAVSSDGKVVVGRDSSSGSSNPFIWRAETGMQIIPGYSADARDISGNGYVVVLDNYYGSYHRAYRWTQAEGEIDIGYGRVYATNWDGSVIVGSNNNQAFVWDRLHGMRYLKDILQSLSVSGLDGWQFKIASDVSDDGTTIIGYGTNPAGQTEAWVANIASADPSIHPNLTAWWKFDETSGIIAEDSAGNADGTLTNGPLWAEGVNGSGLSLDGIDDYVKITGYKGITAGSSRTCTAWIKNTTAGDILAWGNNSAAGNAWIIQVDQTGRLRTDVSGGYICGTTLINDGNWHYIAVVLNDDGSPSVSEILLYVDGRPENITAVVNQSIHTAGDQDVSIGVFALTGTRYFKGLIDDVRIFNAALNETEIRDAAGIPLGLPFSGGSGTAQNPYQIRTSQELYYLSVHPEFWKKEFILMDDIDLTSPGQIQPERIGTDSEHPFGGKFNGNSHTIKGLQIQPRNDYVGLFGALGDYDYSTTTIIKDLTLLDPQITITAEIEYVGVLAGRIQESQILRCNILNADMVLSSPSSYSYHAGLLAGIIVSSTVTDVCCVGSINGNYTYTGGITGYALYTNFYNCSAEGSFTGLNGTGGLAGKIGRTMTINRCSAKGSVHGKNGVGGFIGLIEMDEHSTYAEIIDCYSQSSVTGQLYVGGFNGYSSINTGGILIQNCYTASSVSGTNNIGGFTGYCYLSNNYLPADYVGCFWDAQINQNLPGISNTSDPALVGETTSNMQLESTYTNAGWDFVNTWYMNGYPSLKLEINPLQVRIDAASNGATITVQPGLYQGRLYFKGKNITLTSINPQDPGVVASTIIQGADSGSVITFAGTETSACCLRGFTITGGNSPTNGGGVIGNDCAATIQNCCFYGNTATAGAGGAVWGVHGLIENCMIYNNLALWGGGIAKSNGTIRNCLIFDNQSANVTGLNNCDGTIENCTIISSHTMPLLRICDGTIKNCILDAPATVFDTCTAAVSYTCWPGAAGTGNISADPMFIDPANDDYHLLPGSPCIDAGDPSSVYSSEPWPNGSRINMGAYGNTLQAANSRDGLVPLGFVTVNKIRVGRTSFEYELAVVIHNSNTFDMTHVQLKLVDWDTAVQSVSDDRVAIDTIPAGATVTSTDTFKIVVDRSQSIMSSCLTWQLSYYTTVSGDQVQEAMMSMPLSALDAAAADITGDGNVNLDDFAILSWQWNTTPGTPSADIALPLDGYVGIEDLMYLIENWLN